MSLNPMQQVMLTVLLGPEDPKAWERLKRSEGVRRRKEANPEKYREKLRERNRERAEYKKAWSAANSDPEKRRRYYRLNRETIINRTRKWVKDNPERVKEAARMRHKNSPAAATARTALWRIKNPGRRNIVEAAYREKNRDRLHRYQVDWRNANREKIRSARRVKEARRYALSPHFRLKKTIRARILLALKHNQKAGRTVELIGCSIPELRAYLESLFKPGMTWENHGEWEIDHKKPCSRFNLEDPAQQRICFHYTNLQPLWASENRKKSDSYAKV